MAKTFKSIETTYDVKGMWFDRATFALKDFDAVMASKSETVIKKRIAAAFDCKPTDVRIDSITPNTVTKSVKVHASMEEILDACRAAGITVEEIAPETTDEGDNA